MEKKKKKKLACEKKVEKSPIPRKTKSIENRKKKEKKKLEAGYRT